MSNTSEKRIEFGNSVSRVYKTSRAILIALIIFLLIIALEIIPPTINDYLSSKALLKSSTQTYEEMLSQRNTKPTESIEESLQSEKTAGRIIRVATFRDAFWYGRLNSNEVSGYGPRFLKEISRHTGWTYEFIPTTIAEAPQKLRSGEIDLIAPRIYSASDGFIYTSRPAGVMASVYLVNSSSEIAYRDFSTFAGKRFGGIKGTASIAQLEEDALLNNYSYKLTLFDSNAALLQALVEGTIDVAVASDICISNKDDFRLVHAFVGTPFHFAISPSEVELARELNMALEKINTLNPDFNSQLSKEFVFGRNISSLTFNPAELHYIKRAGTIRVGFIDKQIPRQYKASTSNPTASGAAGVLGNALDLISQKSRLKFQAVPFDSAEKLKNAVASRQVEMVAGFTPSGKTNTSDLLVPTPHYTSSAIVVLQRSSEVDKVREAVAVPRDLEWLALELKKDLGSVPVLVCETVNEGMKLLASKKIDALYADSLELEHLLSSQRIARNYSLSYSDYVHEYTFGVSKKEDPALLSVVSNSIYALNMLERNRLSSENLFEKNQGVSGFFRSYTLEISLVSLIIISSLFLLMWHERRKVLDQINENAFTDSLTGLSNRNHLLHSLSQLIENESAFGNAIISLDINNFKSINNLYSESLGDELLVHIGGLLREALPKDSILAHDIADIFFMYLPLSDLDDIERYILDSIMPHEHIYFKNAGELKLSFVLGIYLIQPEDASPGSILNKADVARLAGKHDLNKKINFFTNEMHHNLMSSSILENDLKLALTRDEFIVHYQPCFDVNSMQTYTHEALIRWNHQLAGLVYPSDFIPLAENLGIITRISSLMFEQVCIDLSRLRTDLDLISFDDTASSHQSLKIAVNMSAKDILSSNTIPMLNNTCEKYGISPAHFQIEVTESVVLEDKVRAIRSLQDLKSMGFSIALDDFGTGYSSLGLLNELPVDMVKIDKKFIRDVEIDAKARQVLESIVALINGLDLKSVAEGIETEFQLNFLREIGCHYGQGYIYSEPLTFDQIRENYLDDASALDISGES